MTPPYDLGFLNGLICMGQLVASLFFLRFWWRTRDGLFAAWERFEGDLGLRVAILTATGAKAFCAGGDLKEMAELKLTVPPRGMV